MSESTDLVRALQTEKALKILGDEQERLLRLANGIQTFIQRLNTCTFESASEVELLSDSLAKAIVASQALEATRQLKKAPVLKDGRDIDGVFKPALDAFEQAEKAAKRKIAEFLQRQIQLSSQAALRAGELKLEAERKREEAVELSRSAVTEDEKQTALECLKDSTNFLIDSHRAATEAKPSTKIQSSLASNSMRFNVVAIVTNLSLVPREYLEDAIRSNDSTKEALKSVLKKAYKESRNQITIDGVSFMNEPAITTRVKR